METIYFDFNNIQTKKDFYENLKEKITLPEFFGNNLDALYDTLTGIVKLPLMFFFENITQEQIQAFGDLLKTLDDAEAATKGEFSYDFGVDD
jgi:ribonuclease inhibitor